MSRFEEVVNDAIGEVVLGESALRAETLAQHIAEKVRDRQGARRAEVHIEARYPGAQAGAGVRHPHAGDLLAARRRRGERGRHAPAGRRPRPGHDRVPVRADARRGALARAAARRRLLRGARSSASSRPSPSPRTTSAGSGTLHIGCPEDCDNDIDAEALLAIVENSMSSEIYELMKRSDEGAVVEKAHRRPRFVEDCVREMVRGVIEQLPDPHRPALRVGPPGEPGDDPPAQRDRRAVRARGRDAARAASGEHSAHHVSMREWLDGRA